MQKNGKIEIDSKLLADRVTQSAEKRGYKGITVHFTKSEYEKLKRVSEISGSSMIGIMRVGGMAVVESFEQQTGKN